METGEDEVLVVDCRGNMQTGCLGGMLMTALATNGAAGLVVDGCVRDLPEAIGLADELPVFVRGGTPHNAGHYEMYPWSFQEPVGCGGALVLPNDVIVGDDDGVVVVPPNLIEQVIEYLLRQTFLSLSPFSTDLFGGAGTATAARRERSLSGSA